MEPAEKRGQIRFTSRWIKLMVIVTFLTSSQSFANSEGSFDLHSLIFSIIILISEAILVFIDGAGDISAAGAEAKVGAGTATGTEGLDST